LPQSRHLYRCLPFCLPSFLTFFEPQKKAFFVFKGFDPA